jgi:protein dithiol oxidoreductase (disulfide-forming)
MTFHDEDKGNDMTTRRGISRRHFSAAAAAGLTAPAWAQGGPVEGTHYVRLGQPAPVAAPAGKIEVVEFFSYGCPHCFALEPLLEDWLKKLPSDVAFRRMPVGFNASFTAYQTLYFGLEAMGKVEQVHKRIFTAIHVQRARLDREADQVAFLNANGIDGAQYAKLSKDFHVSTKARQAAKLVDAYKIDGVPALGVQGRFYTAGSLAGDHARSLAVTDFLIQRARKNA